MIPFIERTRLGNYYSSVPIIPLPHGREIARISDFFSIFRRYYSEWNRNFPNWGTLHHYIFILYHNSESCAKLTFIYRIPRPKSSYKAKKREYISPKWDKRPLMSQDRMELWSNNSLTEFAIKFNSTIVVNSSNNPGALVKMIDECPYKDGYDVDWRYTLSQWVVYYLANKYAVLINSKISVQKEFNIRDEDDDEIYSSYPPVSIAIKMKNKLPPKPGLKCHFCNLKYCLEEERKQHEEFWHSNKIKI